MGKGKSLEEILKELEQERADRLQQEKLEEQKINEKRELARQEWHRRNKMYESAMSVAAGAAGAGGGGRKPSELTVTITDFDPAEFSPIIYSVSVNVTGGRLDVIERGIVYSNDPEPVLSVSPSYVVIDDDAGFGNFTLTNINVFDFYDETTYLSAYATTTEGTTYSATVSWIPQLCLVEGTKVTLSDLSSKNIEDVEYTDELLVWDFDNAGFETSNPLWIKKSEKTNRYNLLTFSDGSFLKTISQHRIFNKEAGMFTYPMTNDTPIGTTTFNMLGNEVTLVSKEIINEEVEYYNIITNKHINLFANNILTSCRYNNIYPIFDMKFTKDNRVLRDRSEFNNISDKYYHGLRLNEQTFKIEDIERYINTLIKFELKLNEVFI